jgi:hypothetical protein
MLRHIKTMSISVIFLPALSLFEAGVLNPTQKLLFEKGSVSDSELHDFICSEFQLDISVRLVFLSPFQEREEDQRKSSAILLKHFWNSLNKFCEDTTKRPAFAKFDYTTDPLTLKVRD